MGTLKFDHGLHSCGQRTTESSCDFGEQLLSECFDVCPYTNRKLCDGKFFLPAISVQ